jgi:chemotaxis signal transduction protein
MSNAFEFEARTTELRHAFDHSFALPPAQAVADVDDLLAIRVGGSPYGVRLREISGIIARRKIIPVPNAASHLLGVAGLRGAILPVFSFASILGHAAGADLPRWMILSGTDAPIGLGFSDFDGHLRLPRSSFHADVGASTATGYVKEVASTKAGVVPVISVSLLVAALRNHNGPTRLEKEQ